MNRKLLPRLRTSHRSWLLLTVVSLAANISDHQCAAAEAVTEAGASSVDFGRDVLPILSNKCFQCHGPDDATREADLRLDTPEGIVADLGDHAAIVPGDVSSSELFRRVTSDDELEKMPPPDSDYPALTAAEIETLRNWIEQGAHWTAHWAFITPERPALPMSTDANWATWPRNAIDHFTLRAMRQRGLTPSPEASRETLIRRLTYDLTGLPPTIAEIDAFLADTSPNAYEKVVDRLLKSPHYGEHMTRYWLDAARYGDTHGLHLDNVRSLWPYRDWLIEAFNDNMPFDEMTIQQLAGDLLEQPTVDQRVATGFNRCNVTTSEGGSIAEEFYVRYTVDRVETMGTVYMGLTLGCAVCHDHKFDPITQKEFYGLFAFFNSFNENPMDGNALLPPPIIELPSAEQQEQRSALQKERDALSARIRDYIAGFEYSDPVEAVSPDEIPKQEYVWIEDAVPPKAKPQQSGHPWEFVSAPEPIYAGEQATKRVASGLAQHFFTGANPPLVIGKGDTLFAYVYLDPTNPPETIMLQWNDGSWEHRAVWGANLIDWGQNDTPSRRLMGELPALGEWVRLEVPAQQVGLKPGAKVNGWAFTQHGGTVYWDHAGIVTRTPQEGQSYDSQKVWELAVAGGAGLPKPVQDALKVKAEERNDAQKKVLRDHFLEHVLAESRDHVAPWRKELEGVEKELKTLNDAIPKSMIVEELAQPKEAFVLIRGEYDKKGDPVERHVPATLPPLPEEAPQNRLGLAKWLVDPSHPLTSRVTVNRWWQRIFGTGLVKTSEDFGVQGEPPSHPELLDWLAVEFIESGWDIKHMQKLMVMSATYRQQAAVTPRSLEVDPYNRYLSYSPRFRLDAEAIRDTALSVSGLLNDDIGGPSVKPYQPAGLWKAVGYTNSNTANFSQDDGSDLYRRSMYTFWKRTAHPPAMAMFDAPSRESCTVRRARTNTPLQALALLNDRQFVEAARHFGDRLMQTKSESDTATLKQGFRMVTGRTPEEDELAVLLDAFQTHRAHFDEHPDLATEFIDSATTQKTPQHLDRDRARDPELAAWTMIANLLLNLDETLNRS